MFPWKKKQEPSPFSFAAEETGIRRVLARIFRERELLIRSDGEVKFLRFGPRFQMAVAAILVGGTIWAATALPVAVMQRLTISTNESQIFEAKLAYEDLLEEIIEYRDTVDEVTAELRASKAELEAQLAQAGEFERQLAEAGDAQSGPRNAVAQSRRALQQHLDKVNGALTGVTNDGEELESMIAKIRADLAASDNGRALVQNARARLKERAEGLEHRLSMAVSQNQKLDERNAALTSNLQVTTAERNGLLKQRKNLRNSIEKLDSQIAALEHERSRLESANATLTGELDESRSLSAKLKAERDGLQEVVAALDSELIVTRAQQDVIWDDLRGVAQSLQEVTGDATELEGSPRQLRTQIDNLLADLTNRQAVEEVVLQRATERAASSIQEVEKIVAMTGLEPDRLLKRARRGQLGQGGPFIAAADIASDEKLGDTMLSLESNMTRWEALTEVLRVLPLALPVDTYHLTSTFGPRIDPVKKRRSQHNGIDMGGWTNTPIWAAAPGTVVHSGRKGRYGIVVEIDHGFGIKTRYAHLNKALVEVGEVVGHRQRIALLGSTGRSTGPHLHYEVLYDGKPLDPMKFIKAGRYVFKN
ncbi:MAG: peptidoglycan DD-metalloendopeptidase family protein [Rhodospirillales bacterium]|nr:MAG: peptidoglycan DD-metalloendopeptidase family protein [Rhodospirillales bacterium]